MGLLVACTQPRFVDDASAGDTSDASQPSTDHGADGWIARPEWPGRVRRIAPERDKSARVVRVVSDPERRQFWVLSYAEVAPDVAPRFVLRRYDHAGKSTWTSADSEPFRAGVDALGAIIGDIVLHDDGGLSVLVLTPYDDYDPLYGAWSTVRFMRLDADGNLLREGKLDAPLAPQARLWCDETEASWECRPESPDDLPNRSRWLAFFREKGVGFPLANRLIADGDDLILLRASDLYRLQRLDADYRVVADAVVLPGGAVFRYAAPRITRDASGHVIVLHLIDETLLAMLASAGGPKLSLAELTGGDATRDEGVMLQYFDPVTLERIAAHLTAPPERMRPSALVADGDEVVAVLNYDPGNRDRRGDVVLMRARVGNANPRYQRFGLAYTDAATDAVVLNGRVWLSGITNDGQLDHDTVGLVTSIDREGDVGPVIELSGPRNVQVDMISANEDGDLLIGGIENVANLNGCSRDVPKCDARAFVATLRPPRPTGDRRADFKALPSRTWLEADGGE